MLVKDWIEKFMIDHQARFRVADWPERGCEEYSQFAKLWLRTFITAQVTLEEADLASLSLGENPPNFAREHLAGLMSVIRAGRVVSIDDMSRAEAEAASKSCPFCGGSGLPTVFRPEYNGSPTFGQMIITGEIVYTPARVCAYCECQAGKWIRKRHMDDAECKDIIGRYPHMSTILHGNSAWLEFDPTAPDGPDEYSELQEVRRISIALAERIRLAKPA